MGLETPVVLTVNDVYCQFVHFNEWNGLASEGKIDRLTSRFARMELKETDGRQYSQRNVLFNGIFHPKSYSHLDIAESGNTGAAWLS